MKRRDTILILALTGLLSAAALFGQETPPAEPQPAVPPAAAPPATAGEELGAVPAPSSAEAETPSAPPTEEGAPPPAPAEDRITFELTFPPEKGGGSATGSAGGLETSGEDEAIATGGVEVHYQDVVLTADRVVFHRQTKSVEAEGNVVVDQGPGRILGERLTFDLETKTGTFYRASAHLNPDYYFTGDEISKVGENSYTVRDGVFTSCTGDPTPDWSFRLARARVEIEGYARIRHASMWVKKLPVFYTPYILWPAKTERTSGFLIPNIGYSESRGAYLGLAYFQVLGRSADSTLYLDAYAEDFLGFGQELRYRPSERTIGDAKIYFLRDPVEDDWNWKALWDHQTTSLPWGMRGVVAYNDYSDFDFFRNFERRVNVNTQRSLYSKAFLSGNWGVQSLNVLLDQRETFLSGGATLELRQLPEIEYRLQPTKLGRSPLYFQLLSTTSYLQNQRSATLESSYARADLLPIMSLPIRTFPWLSVSLAAGGRATWYGDSLAPGGQGFAGDSLTRVLPLGSAEIVGPSFSRVFTGGRRYSKYKHIIEPRWSYNYLGDYDDLALVPNFDEIDNLRTTNTGAVSLINRLLAKPVDEKEGGAREIASFELTQGFSFDSEQPLQRSADGSQTSAKGPIRALLRFNPVGGSTLQAQADYNTLFGGLDRTSLSTAFNIFTSRLGATWFTSYRAETGDKLSDQLRVFAGLDLWPGRLRLDAQVNYDLKESVLQQQRFILGYVSQCYSLRLEAFENRSTTRRDRDYRFSLTLKNVGTFLDLTGGTSDTL